MITRCSYKKGEKIMNVLLLITPKSKVEYLQNDFSIRQSLEKMDYHHYSAIPLLTENGEYVGVISEGDILWYAKRQNDFSLLKSEKISINDVSRNREYLTAHSYTTIEELFPIILSQNFVPIVDDRNIFIGIVTRKDILNFFYQRLTHKEKVQ